MKQLTILTAKNAFAFRANDKGRAIQAKQGERFEVMTSEVSNMTTQTAQIAREGKGKLGTGWLFSLAQISELFEISA